MIRTIIRTNSNSLTLTIPDKYIGKELEVIAFDRTETIEEMKPSKKISFTVLHTDVKNYKFDRDEANER
jgi:hypothetical protein